MDLGEGHELEVIRKRLKLTQAQAAKLAAAVINLLRMLDKHPDLIKELA